MSSPIIYCEEFELKRLIREIESDTLLIIVDKVVLDLYQDKFEFDKLDKQVILYPVTAGEGLKSFTELEKCLEFFLAQRIHRKSHLLAIGGGTVSDFAGLVASMLLRGIPWTVIPTTLLAMVDAAIGGKVGINSKYGKNLIGDFYLPSQIINCSDFLKTLPEIEIASGKGEILKYALLDKSCYIHIENNRPLKDIIRTCADFKNRIVERDFQEEGARKILNLGHTFGHAFEFLQGMPHGLAVVQGIITILNIDHRPDALSKVNALIAKLELKKFLTHKDSSVSGEQLFEAVERDKKLTSKGKIELITIRDIGYHVIEELPLEVLREKFLKVWNLHA